MDMEPIEFVLEYLVALAVEECERANRDGYLKTPDREFMIWDDIASWPPNSSPLEDL